ncbi:MAG: nucleotidyl transferase AbiEii/AbiGii toxin family protein [Paludibacteraceae bacterium]
MLQKQTIEPGTLSILNALMEIPELSNFNLVGGTALALKYGHRKSIDLDLFSVDPFDRQIIINTLQDTFDKSFEYDGSFSKWGIFGYIDNVKVDVVYYPHSLLEAPVTDENIRFASDKDLIAMKIQAILGRGKKKDFWDVAEILKHFHIQEIINFHKAKYPNQMLGITIPQALVYFVDAEDSVSPVSLNMSWEEVKTLIKQKVNDYLK